MENMAEKTVEGQKMRMCPICAGYFPDFALAGHVLDIHTTPAEPKNGPYTSISGRGRPASEDFAPPKAEAPAPVIPKPEGVEEFLNPQNVNMRLYFTILKAELETNRQDGKQWIKLTLSGSGQEQRFLSVALNSVRHDRLFKAFGSDWVGKKIAIEPITVKGRDYLKVDPLRE